MAGPEGVVTRDLRRVLPLTPCVSPNSPSIRAPAGSEGLLRLHILISARCTRRRNNLEMTAARRRDLHVAVNPGRWADHPLRVGEFVAQWPRTATTHGWRVALGVRRTCRPLLGRRVVGGLRQHHTALCKANKRCNDHNGQAQKAIPHTLADRVRQRPPGPHPAPPPPPPPAPS